MVYFVYVLRSLSDGKLYIGSTSDVGRRLKEHNRGVSKSTRFRRPFILIYTEEFSTRALAVKREWYFKNTGVGNGWLKSKLNIMGA